MRYRFLLPQARQGRQIVAHGDSRGKRMRLTWTASPGRGERLLSSNDKARIKIHSMFLEQRYDLFLIRQLAVMLFLMRNVRLNLAQLGLADTERRVPCLPRKPAPRRALVCPLRRIGLKFLHEICKGKAGGKNKEQMDVVRGTVDQHGLAAKVSDDATQVGVKVGFHLGTKKRLAILHAEQGVGRLAQNERSSAI